MTDKFKQFSFFPSPSQMRKPTYSPPLQIPPSQPSPTKGEGIEILIISGINDSYPEEDNKILNDENRPSFWVKATVTKPVWFKGRGLRRVLKTNPAYSGITE
jgi:hypothetical protein